MKLKARKFAATAALGIVLPLGATTAAHAEAPPESAVAQQSVVAQEDGGNGGGNWGWLGLLGLIGLAGLIPRGQQRQRQEGISRREGGI